MESSAGRTEGKIGILGPKRMDYSKAVAVVSIFEHKLSGLFLQGQLGGERRVARSTGRIIQRNTEGPT